MARTTETVFIVKKDENVFAQIKIENFNYREFCRNVAEMLYETPSTNKAILTFGVNLLRFSHYKKIFVAGFEKHSDNKTYTLLDENNEFLDNQQNIHLLSTWKNWFKLEDEDFSQNELALVGEVSSLKATTKLSLEDFAKNAVQECFLSKTLNTYVLDLTQPEYSKEKFFYRLTDIIVDSKNIVSFISDEKGLDQFYFWKTIEDKIDAVEEHNEEKEFWSEEEKYDNWLYRETL